MPETSRGLHKAFLLPIHHERESDGGNTSHNLISPRAREAHFHHNMKNKGPLDPIKSLDHVKFKYKMALLSPPLLFEVMKNLKVKAKAIRMFSVIMRLKALCGSEMI